MGLERSGGRMSESGDLLKGQSLRSTYPFFILHPGLVFSFPTRQSTRL